MSQASGTSATPLKTLGQSTPRIDAINRVTGKAMYTGDLRLPGMLFARVLRSPHPHANIRRLDVSKARALPGVKAILTPENCRVTWAKGGDEKLSPRFLFANPVRFVGDAVAAVAAVDRHVAEEAIRLIEVDYEQLPFVLDPEDALKPDAVKIWPTGNGQAPQAYKRGDVEEAFRTSHQVFEDRYTTVHHNNAQMEMRVAIAEWNGDKLTVYASTQGISTCQTDIATDLKIAPEKVRVVCQYMGGGFGNKNQNHDFDLMAALLAKEAGVPVKVEFTRREDFTSVHGRWSTKQSYKIGVNADGTVRAIQLRGTSGMGAYRKGSGGIDGFEVYASPNVDTVVTPVLTNVALGANYRAPPTPQGIFGLESLMDHIAYEMKIDPVEFRLKNFSRKFRDSIPYTSNGLEECINRGAAAIQWKALWHPAGADNGPIKRGVGMAMGSFSSGLGRSSAVLRLDASGRYYLYVGVTDIGTGAKTAMALIAAEELGVPLNRIDVIHGDTDRCPFSVGESGSRTTVQTGSAVVEAAKDLKRQIAEKGLPTGDAVLVANATTNPRLEGASRYSFGAHFVQVEVDTELGRARVIKYVAVHDSGRIVNPLAAVSQVKGGAIQGLGMALHEELHYDPRSGVPLNAGFYGARVPTHRDAPEVEVIFVEPEDAYGPFGAKGLGEMCIVPSVGAIANAIYNAIGRRIKDLPITREKILGALA